MLEDGDEYYWIKNIRPDAQSNRDRNTATNYIMRDLKTSGIIVKTYHVDCGVGEWERKYQEEMDGTVLSQDFTPFIKYSVNKKKRWELWTEEHMQMLLEQLKNAHDEMDVVVAERSTLISLALSYIEFPQYFRQFPIRRFHQILAENTYTRLSTNAVLGQPIEHFRPSKQHGSDLEEPKKAEKTMVAYHFITAPKNYEELMKNEFCPGRHGRRLKHRTIFHEKRVENMFETQKALRYASVENVEEDVDITDDNTIHNTYPLPRKFYNWEDHIVEKFVSVKKTRTKNASCCSSDWSVVSD